VGIGPGSLGPFRDQQIKMEQSKAKWSKAQQSKRKQSGAKQSKANEKTNSATSRSHFSTLVAFRMTFGKVVMGGC
jgi:hypothetical protein